VYGIPEFRLPKAIVQREVDYIASLGVEVKSDMVIGRTFTIDELMSEEGYNAVFLGVGAGLPWFMEIPGENLNGVYSANEYLTRSNLMKAYKFPESDTPIIRSKNVAVIGGGNVAYDVGRTVLRQISLDAARTALRERGVGEVVLCSLESLDEMPADRGVIFVRDEETGDLLPEVVRFRSRKARAEHFNRQLDIGQPGGDAVPVLFVGMNVKKTRQRLNLFQLTPARGHDRLTHHFGWRRMLRFIHDIARASPQGFQFRNKRWNRNRNERARDRTPVAGSFSHKKLPPRFMEFKRNRLPVFLRITIDSLSRERLRSTIPPHRHATNNT
jgi:hypothetical protein